MFFIKSAFAEQAVRGAPAVGGALIESLTRVGWVGWLTGLYIVIQALYLLRKWYREEADWRGKKRGRK